MAGLSERLLIFIDSKVDGAIKGIRDVEDAADKAGKEAGPLGRLRGAFKGMGVDASAAFKGIGLGMVGVATKGLTQFADLTKSASGELGQFGRIVLL